MLVSLSANLFDPKHPVDELRLSTGGVLIQPVPL